MERVVWMGRAIGKELGVERTLRERLRVGMGARVG